MGQLMWVEVVGKHGEVEGRYRFPDGTATIGRAPDNDVVVDDPYVAPHHARITRDENGQLIAEDLGSINGLFTEHGKQRETRIQFGKAHGMRIGRTHVRVRDGSEAVAPERVLAPLAAHGNWVLGLTLVLLALAMVDLWLDLTGEVTPRHFVFPVMGVAVLVLLWSSAWSLISRIFAGQALYAQHLRIGLTAAVCGVLLAQFKEWLSYAVAAPYIVDKDVASVWIILAVACYFHFRVMHVRNMKLAMGLIGGVVASVIVLQLVTLSEAQKLMGQQVTLGSLKPPSLRLASPVTDAEFLSELEAMKSRLDVARKKEPVSSGLLDGLDGDD